MNNFEVILTLSLPLISPLSAAGVINYPEVYRCPSQYTTVPGATGAGAWHAWSDAWDARALVSCDQLSFSLDAHPDDKCERTTLVIVTFLSVSLKRIRNSLSVIIVMSKLHKKSIYPFLDFYQKHR